jgi:BCD family chlorophyll transporter-like MFS transporter
MLLLGMVGAGLVYGVLLADYSHTRLVQVVQGTAVASVLLNAVAMWKQEPRHSRPALGVATRGRFAEHWRRVAVGARAGRLLVALGLGTAAFGMQDVILEPYGGEILHLGVGATTQLTALMAAAALVAFALAARALGRGSDPHRVAAVGVLAGLAGFSAVIFAEPAASAQLFRAGVAAIGLGGGLFSVGTLTAAMALDAQRTHAGLVLGAWGAVQATALGSAVFVGGALRDLVSGWALAGALGPTLQNAATGYAAVYHIELLMLFATLAALGPLAGRRRGAIQAAEARPLGLAEFPG